MDRTVLYFQQPGLEKWMRTSQVDTKTKSMQEWGRGRGTEQWSHIQPPRHLFVVVKVKVSVWEAPVEHWDEAQSFEYQAWLWCFIGMWHWTSQGLRVSVSSFVKQGQQCQSRAVVPFLKIKVDLKYWKLVSGIQYSESVWSFFGLGFFFLFCFVFCRLYSNIGYYKIGSGAF